MGTGLQIWSPDLLFSDVMPIPSRVSEKVNQGLEGQGRPKAALAVISLLAGFTAFTTLHLLDPTLHGAQTSEEALYLLSPSGRAEQLQR